MSVRRPLAIALLAVAATAACSDRDTTAPDAAQLGAGARVPGDTSSVAPLPEQVRVRGRVLATTKDGPRAPGDTLAAFAPVAGARVTVYRNVLENGAGVSKFVAEQVTGADGAFDFRGVPGGYYVVSLNVTPERFYGETHVLVAGTKAEVSADIRIWSR